MRTAFSAITLVIAILTSSCATIVSGSRQTIQIASEPASATVYINEVEVGKTPVEQHLKRNQEYQLLIRLDGYEPFETLISKSFNAWYLGNIVFGGIIGLIVDASTGAIFKLTPKELNAHLDNRTALRSEGNDLYLTVSLDIDPNWEKIGQLKKSK